MMIECIVLHIHRRSDDQTTAVVSPFSEDHSLKSDGVRAEGGELEFSAETADKILYEIRIYLILDRGNISVQIVDLEQKNVYHT